MQKKEFQEVQELEQNIVILSYPINMIQDKNLLPRIVKKAANMTHEKGYENFLLFRSKGPDTRFEMTIFMYNDSKEIPPDMLRLERFNAEEYMNKEYVPLGLDPRAA